MKLMSMNEVCEKIGCNYNWLRWEIDKNKLVTPMKVGCAMIFTEHEIETIRTRYANRPSTKWKTSKIK